ncbi:MAG: alginate lyase family protein [Planctomycetes bacterium]|nr:alginate lyase family protein [Planctomycetota bacterium]
MSRIRNQLEILRLMGPRWVAFRATYAVRKKSGALRRSTPPIDLNALPLSHVFAQGGSIAPAEIRTFFEHHAGRFFFNIGHPPDRMVLRQIARDDGVARTIAVADDYCVGRFLYYSHKSVDHGLPVDWLRVADSKLSHTADTHWSDYPTFSPELGDVKTVWEPSRFACAFWLARAYAFTGDAKYPAAFWNLLESWSKQNPPNMGPNWKCGQEASLRAFAWLFALHVFWPSPETTPERVGLLVRLLAVTARRVDANIDYAVSQKNNHGISEAAGLFTIGTLLPFLRDADQWRERGRKFLEQEIARQIYDDGSFVQHSMNYHRLMLHDCLWVMRIAELNGRPLSGAFRRRVALATEFIFEMLNPQNGGVPNYGGNDGALILPLDACDYTDYRPVIQAAMYATAGQRVMSAGPWDESGAWLYGDAFLQAPMVARAPTSRRFDPGGYYTIRGRKSWCMVRCHAYRDRPAHVDMHHLDLWFDDCNIISDSGTYLYYSPSKPAFEKFFKDNTAHNTIELDGRGPLQLASRFLWIPWPKAECLNHGTSKWRGESHAYNRGPSPVIHRRGVELVSDNKWLITDELTGQGAHDVILRWHLADGTFEHHAEKRWFDLELCCGKVRLSFDMPDAFKMTVRRGDESAIGVMGWQSRYYGRKRQDPPSNSAADPPCR